MEFTPAKPEGRLPMTGFKLYAVMAFGCMFASAAFADIYEWTDADGIKHYSNYAPPENSRILMKTKEEPYDEAADRARAQAERQAQLEAARLEIAQREADLEQRESEAERRLAEADRLAEETLRDAESYIEEAEDSRSGFRSYGYNCYDYYYGCSYPLYGRWYYRNETGSIFFKKPAYAVPYRHYRYPKHYDGRYRNDFHHQSRFGMSYRPEAYHSKSHLHPRSGNIPGGTRTGPRGGTTHGRGSFSGRGSGIGWRR
jgi:hypothetical protein